MRIKLTLLSLLLTGCAASVIPAFEQARNSALADPGPAAPDWEADAVISLSESQIDHALERLLAVHGQVESSLDAGLFVAIPKLGVKDVTVHDARCMGCVRVEATLGGHLEVRTGLGNLKVPADVKLDLDAVFDLVQDGPAWTLRMAPRKIHSIDADLAGTDFKPLTREITAWVSDALTLADPLPIANLGSSALPLRAMRVRAGNPGLILELLTATPTPVAVLEPDQMPENGWRLDLAADTLLDLARIASFESAPLPRDIVAEPTSLSVTGDQFELGLRLWGVRGRGWWRDYAVSGNLSVVDREIALTPHSVQDLGHSDGAGWVDPLAALGQGVILKALERALQTSVPAEHRDGGKKLAVLVSIEQIEGRGAVVVAHGGLKLGD